MYSPEKLRLNKFRPVKCASPRDLFSRIGKREPLATGSNDGSSYSDCVDFNSSNLDRLNSMSKEENLRLYDEYKDSLSNPSETSSVSRDSNES